MSELISLESALRFKMFSQSHLIFISVIVLINLLIVLCRQRLRAWSGRDKFPLLLAVLLISVEILLQLWFIYTGTWSVESALPFHLCSATLLLSVLMLVRKSFGCFEIVYFWGLGGSSQALLTPDLWYGFPHFLFINFFLSHGLVICACFWLVVVEGYRPHFSSLIKAVLISIIYLAVIGVFNHFIGSNYLYLCSKPANPSLLDVLGPWPWYILFLQIIGIIYFSLLYFPFVLIKSPLPIQTKGKGKVG